MLYEGQRDITSKHLAFILFYSFNHLILKAELRWEIVQISIK